MNAETARERIRARSDVKAFISLTDGSGEGTIVGVSYVVEVRGTINTGGAIILPSDVSQEDAPVVTAMRACGCLIVGKTNLHEFAFGVTSVNQHYAAVG